MEPYSQAIGRFVRGLTLADIPQGVVDKAKLVFLDTIGVALASSAMDFGAMVTRVAQALGVPLTAISRCLSKVAAANAVLANRTLAHGLDYDDTLEEAIVAHRLLRRRRENCMILIWLNGATRLDCAAARPRVSFELMRGCDCRR